MKKRKERKYYDDPKDNAAFLRCVDLLAGLIEKYADVVLGRFEIIRCDYFVVKDTITNLIEVTPLPDVKEIIKAFAKYAKSHHEVDKNFDQHQDKAA
ncbi:MAG: hypothetical protein IJU77_14480 [Butyrivibrio sp.]|nr:hypothetical protein [Butyrivibrio sp.]